MRKVLIAAGVAAILGAAPSATIAQNGNTTCFFKGEQTSPGAMTKICMYDCLGSPAAITVNSTSICPLSIKR